MSRTAVVQIILVAAIVVLVLAPLRSTAGSLLADPPKGGSSKDKARPSQQAVLAKSTVVRYDVPYGGEEKQRLDVYSPKGVKGAPIVVFIHGGEWTRGDKSAVSYKPRFLNENGIVLVSINYRLTPAVTHPAHVADVAAAVRWVHDHAAEISGDPKKVVLMGHSAGCHLATLTALDPRYLQKVKLKPADLRGVVAWSGGAYDLVGMVKAGGAYAGHIKNAFGGSQSAWQAASPVTHAKNARGGPRFLFVSIEAGNASHKAAERLAELIQGAEGKAESRLLEGRDHFNANHLLGSPGDASGKVLLGFIREVTRD
jgi:acetyl esterase/lipase